MSILSSLGNMSRTFAWWTTVTVKKAYFVCSEWAGGTARGFHTLYPCGICGIWNLDRHPCIERLKQQALVCVHTSSTATVRTPENQTQATVIHVLTIVWYPADNVANFLHRKIFKEGASKKCQLLWIKTIKCPCSAAWWYVQQAENIKGIYKTRKKVWVSSPRSAREYVGRICIATACGLSTTAVV